jgi:hypothetical protein
VDKKKLGPPSKNFSDQSWYDGRIMAQLNHLFNYLNYRRDSQKSFINPAENQYRHANPDMAPLTKDEILHMMFGPDSVPEKHGGVFQGGKSIPGHRSPYWDSFNKAEDAKWKKSFPK